MERTRAHLFLSCHLKGVPWIHGSHGQIRCTECYHKFMNVTDKLICSPTTVSKKLPISYYMKWVHVGNYFFSFKF